MNNINIADKATRKNTYTPSKNFQCEIKRLRIMRKLTQKKFAAAIDVNAATVRNWEHGKNFPHDFTCRMIISAFSLTEEEQALLFIINDNSDNCKLSDADGDKAVPDIPEKAVSPAEDIPPEEVSSHIEEEPLEEAAASEEAEETTVSGEALKEPIVVAATPEEEPSKEIAVSEEPPAEKRKPLHPLLKTFLISLGAWLAAWIVIALICTFVRIDDAIRETTIAAWGTMYIFDWAEFIVVFIVSFALVTGIPVLIHKIIRNRKK